MNEVKFILGRQKTGRTKQWIEQIRQALLNVPPTTFTTLEIPSLPDHNPLEEYFFKVTSNTQN